MEATASEETVDSCSISYLQDIISLEVVLLILQLLTSADKLRLMLTCRRFYMTLSDPAAWQSIEFDYYHTPSRKALDTILSLCSPRVKRLKVNTHKLMPRFPWVRFTKHISKCSPTLTHLSLLGFQPSPEQVNTSLASFSSLSHITLDAEYEPSLQIWVPAVKSLKSLEIRVVNISYFVVSAALKVWSENCFFPHQFQISMIEFGQCGRLHTLLHEIDNFFQCHSVPLDMQAQFYLKYGDGPACTFLHCPFLELKIEDSRCSVPVAQCSDITSAPLLLVLSTPQSATRMRPVEQLPRVCMETPFSTIASTLAHLSLKDDCHLSHENLTHVASHCPLLKSLCLDSCRNALLDLSGLTSISERCLGLELLQLIDIHVEGIDQALLWSVLSNFRKLLYLSVEFCVLPVNCQLPERKIDTLLSVRVGSGGWFSHCIGCRSISNRTLKTTAQVMPTNLRVLRMDFPHGATHTALGSGFNDLLCALPKLQGLYIEKRMNLILPTNLTCYQNIAKLYMSCSSGNITLDFVEALVHSGQLTHCYFDVDLISMEAMCKLIEAPKLVCCHVSCRGRKSPPESKIRKAAKAQGIPDFFYGIGKFSYAPIDPDLNPTWSTY